MRKLTLIIPLIASLSSLSLQAKETPILTGKPICVRAPINESQTYTVATKLGEVSVWDSGGKGRPVLFLHGNSCCKEVFRPQFESALAKQYRFIAIDLPGHGQSPKAQNPEKTYSTDGFAEVVVDVIQKLKLKNPAIVGWSLGGSVALSALARGQAFAGVLITGTPPIELSPEGFQKGYLPVPEVVHLLSKTELTKEEAVLFITATKTGIDLEENPFILEAVLKADGQLRRHMMESIWKKTGVNQKILVETNDTPLCVVHGLNDKVNLNYLKDEVKYKNLFNGKIYEVEDAGHAVFWEKPETFNAILEEFLSKTL